MSKEDSIEVSPKHGVNPFIPACFWCGELKSEIALPGRIRNDPKTGEKVKGGDFEAKHGMIVDYVPCEKCQKNMELGVRMIEAWTLDQFTDHRPPIGKDNEGNDVAPTGRWVMLNEESEFARSNGWHKGQTVMVDKTIMDELAKVMVEVNEQIAKENNAVEKSDDE